MKLLNSAMMPSAGTYYCKQIIFEEFVQIIKDEHAKGSIESYIGYQQNIDLLKKWTGCDIELNRSTTVLKDIDEILVMRINYRPDANAKGIDVDEKDFEFFYVKYEK